MEETLLLWLLVGPNATGGHQQDKGENRVSLSEEGRVHKREEVRMGPGQAGAERTKCGYKREVEGVDSGSTGGGLGE